jgi:hypothetical protein
MTTQLWQPLLHQVVSMSVPLQANLLHTLKMLSKTHDSQQHGCDAALLSTIKRRSGHNLAGKRPNPYHVSSSAFFLSFFTALESYAFLRRITHRQWLRVSATWRM